MLGFAKKLLGSSNDRKVKAMAARVGSINALERECDTLIADNQSPAPAE